MSHVCPECGVSLKHRRTLQNHRFKMHGVRGGDPRLDEATMDELERQSNQNLLLMYWNRLGEAPPGVRKSLRVAGFLRRPRRRRVNLTELGRATLEKLEAEADG